MPNHRYLRIQNDREQLPLCCQLYQRITMKTWTWPNGSLCKCPCFYSLSLCPSISPFLSLCLFATLLFCFSITLCILCLSVLFHSHSSPLSLCFSALNLLFLSLSMSILCLSAILLFCVSNNSVSILCLPFTLCMFFVSVSVFVSVYVSVSICHFVSQSVWPSGYRPSLLFCVSFFLF